VRSVARLARNLSSDEKKPKWIPPRRRSCAPGTTAPVALDDVPGRHQTV